MTIPKANPKLPVPIKVKAIAIIGGGPSAAITLDTLTKQQAFDEIVVFERNEQVGGCWNIDVDYNFKPNINPSLDHDKLNPPVCIPSGLSLETPLTKSRISKGQWRFQESPGYNGLRTNVPRQLMCFSDHPTWNISESEAIDKDYCYAPAVKKYIEGYFERNSVKDGVDIRLNTTVEEIYKDYIKEESKFVLTLRNESKDEDGKISDHWYQQEFDAVIIATGHYNVPYFPKDQSGLDQVFASFPEKIVHSKYFKPSLDTYEDETVIVIGGKISAFDIIASLSKTSKVVYNSKREQTEIKQNTEGYEKIIEKPVITKYKVTENKDLIVYFSDSTTLVNPDRIIFATGYYFSYPFMTKHYPNFSQGLALPQLYSHTIYTKDPLISVIGIPTRAVTFKIFEHQAIYVSAFLAGKFSLPPLSEQIQWCQDRFAKYGNSTLYHSVTEEKFDWIRSLIKESGDDYYDGIKGKKYYEFTKEDEQLHWDVVKRYAEDGYGFLDPTKIYF